MRYFLSFLFAAFPLFCSAQTGHYFLSHYAPADERVDAVAYTIAQDANGLMYYATRSGILQFDGTNWETLAHDGAIYSLTIDANNTLYWAGAKGFGRVKSLPDGTREIVPLAKDEQSFYQTLAVKDRVYFLNEDHVNVVDKKDSIVTIRSQGTGSFAFVFEYFGKTLVSTDEAEVLEIIDNELRPFSFNEEELPIVFTTKLENKYIMGTADDQLYMSTRPGQVRKLTLQDEKYLKASVMMSASWVNGNLLALATLRGGVVFVNPSTGKTEEIVNYHAGLPDNEVLAMMCDRNRNIWVSHEYGLTRIEPFLPFRSFSHYEGLKGNLLCAKSVGNDIYVGTSLGLYKVVREELYDEIVFYEDSLEEVKPNPTVASKQNKVVAPPNEKAVVLDVEEVGPAKKKKGFLRFLKKKEIQQFSPAAEVEPPIENSKIELPPETHEQQLEYVVHRQKKTERFLRASQFVYRKVNGIDSKVTYITTLNGKLIAAGVGGVFEVMGLSATPVLEEPVRYVFASSDSVLYIATYGDKVRTLKYTKRKWTNQHLLDNIDDQISFVFEGNKSNVWLCGINKLYLYNVAHGEAKKIAETQLLNSNFSKTYGVRMGEDIIFVNANGFYKFDAARQTLTKQDSLKPPQRYFVTNSELIYYADHAWKKFGDKQQGGNIHLLSITDNIRFLDSNATSNDLWIITSGNELYKFYGDRLKVFSRNYPLALKSISQAARRLSIRRNFKVSQDEGPLNFEFVQPYFTHADAVEYRYRLAGGLAESWSEWAAQNSSVSFPFLQPAKYKLTVQARDLFGTITELDTVAFEVQPPFWKRPWFYAMEFTVFVLLVLLSFKLSIRYRLVSRVLTLLTIILLIEFIQTVVSSTFITNSSPIIDFIIQVGVAFLILPVEGFLRNLMFRSMGSDSRLYEVITELNQSKKKRK